MFVFSLRHLYTGALLISFLAKEKMIIEIDPCKNEKCDDCIIIINPPCICRICKFNQDCVEKPKYSCDKFEAVEHLRRAVSVSK